MSDEKTRVAETRSRGGIVLWSLALNIFLICGIAAYLASSALYHPAPLRTGGPARQFELLAAGLPPGDGSVLHVEFLKKSEAIDEAHKAAHRTRDAVRQALSAEPYNAEATRQAMSEAEAAHLRLEQLLQDVIASAAAKMTPAGRSRLADWQPGPPRRQ
jgi:uncharacterized membrane protein